MRRLLLKMNLFRGMRYLQVLVIISVLILCAGCYKTVPINQVEQKWWEKGQTWIKVNGYERWIKVKEVQADSVYGEVDVGFSTPVYTKVAVPLDAVEGVKRTKIDPFRSVFGFALVTGLVLGVIFLVQYSKIALD